MHQTELIPVHLPHQMNTGIAPGIVPTAKVPAGDDSSKFMCRAMIDTGSQIKFDLRVRSAADEFETAWTDTYHQWNWKCVQNLSFR